MNARCREHVDAAAEQIFQVLAEADEVEQRPILLHVHEEIQVAVRTRFPAGLRAMSLTLTEPLPARAQREPEDAPRKLFQSERESLDQVFRNQLFQTLQDAASDVCCPVNRLGQCWCFAATIGIENSLT